MEIVPTKVFVTELKVALVFEKQKECGHGSDTLAVATSRPSRLQAVDRNTAECYVEALLRAQSQETDTLAAERFPRHIDIACHDEHASNLKTERCMLAAVPGRFCCRCYVTATRWQL